MVSKEMQRHRGYGPPARVDDPVLRDSFRLRLV